MLELSVRDDGVGIAAGTAMPGHGIENTKERLLALYGERASLAVGNGANGGTIAQLRVPYREITLEADSVGR
jgi:two-component system LytT family sensor kinase